MNVHTVLRYSNRPYSSAQQRVLVVEDHLEIQLTKGLVAVADLSDFDLLVQATWTTLVTKNTNYAYTKGPVLMHRYLLDAKPGEKVDHIDGNGINNRRSNLRICTPQQNGANSRKRAGRPYKGVSVGPNGKWRAYIKVNYKVIALGTFPTAEKAAKAYDRAALYYFREFARPNFP